MSTHLANILNAVLPLLLSLLYRNCDRLMYRVLTTVILVRNAAELRSYQELGIFGLKLSVSRIGQGDVWTMDCCGRTSGPAVCDDRPVWNEKNGPIHAGE
jgi:hypothetical protein